MDDRIVDAAAGLESPLLRSLDAIHLVTAQSLGHDLAGMVVYDRRLATPARHHRLVVWTPR